MKGSETFGVEKGHGEELINWLNEQAQEQGLKLEARLYDHDMTTTNFGVFEMFSWIGDVQTARKLIIKASKRFKVRVVEGGYRTKERTFQLKKLDYAIIRKGDKIIGHLQLESPLLGGKGWKIKVEERR
jgi:hypothetical protein